MAQNASSRNYVVAILLAFFLGGLGAHRFYAGKIGSGIAQLVLTIIGWITAIFVIGFFIIFAVGIWVLIDFIMIILGKFEDGDGNLITNN